MSPRPELDVVMPFAGSDAALVEAVRALERLTTGPGDQVILVDNRPASAGPAAPDVGETHVKVLRAPEVQSSYYARNRGAQHGENRWVLFLDADVQAGENLIDAYFAEPPGPRVAVLAGGIEDEPADDARTSAVGRYAYLRQFLDQRGTMEQPQWAYAKTANCVIRREALEAVGWFREDLRSGGDAEICFRLRAAGWEVAFREDARVIHRSRTTIPAFLRQVAKHGSGSQWLEERYPGFSPRGRWLGLLKWTATCAVKGTYGAVHGDRDRMLLAYLDAARSWAFRIGRYHSNVVTDSRRFRLPQRSSQRT